MEGHLGQDVPQETGPTPQGSGAGVDSCGAAGVGVGVGCNGVSGCTGIVPGTVGGIGVGVGTLYGATGADGGSASHIAPPLVPMQW